MIRNPSRKSQGLAIEWKAVGNIFTPTTKEEKGFHAREKTKLAALHNPRHPEHAAWLEWAGSQFDPAAFDLQRTNELLQVFYSLLMERA